MYNHLFYSCSNRSKFASGNQPPLSGKRDTITSTSTLLGHTDNNGSTPASRASLGLDSGPPSLPPPPPLPFGSYSQHIYDLMPSISKPATIFEDLNGTIEPDGLPLHLMGAENTLYTTPDIPKTTLPAYAVFDDSVIPSRSPSPKQQDAVEYSYADVRRTLTRSFEKAGQQTHSAPTCN